MPIQHWDECRFYDPIQGCDAIRFSGHSGCGVYWISEPASPPGKSRRAQRERALDLIQVAIERGDAPGKVDVAAIEPLLAARDFADDAAESLRLNPEGIF